MSYIIEVVAQELPADERLAWWAADAVRNDLDYDCSKHPQLVRLHDVLTAVYPCLSHCSDAQIGECPWSDGPLIGNVGSRMAEFGLNNGPYSGAVARFIVEAAGMLGLTALDEQAGVIHRPVAVVPGARYFVLVTGVRRGFNKDAVVARLARASRRDEADVRRMLEARFAIVKRDMDQVGALQYRELLYKLGCVSGFKLDTPAGAIDGKGGNHPSDLRRLHEAAHAGDAAARYMLALLLLNGIDCDKDTVEAVKWLELAAAQDHISAQMKLAYCYATGTGVAMSKAWAMNWGRKAAELGDVTAQLALGEEFLEGKTVRIDLVEAERWLSAAANQGSAKAQLCLGTLLRGGQLPGGARPAQALAWLKKAAEQGECEAQLAVADMLWFGEGGLAPDQAQGFVWFEKAAMQGSAWGQSHIGLCYERGQIVERDDARALRWYFLAADQGHALAQSRIGCRYRDGEGLEQDWQKAYTWLVRSANQECAAGQLGLGLLYMMGWSRPGENKRDRARFWLRKASANGEELADMALEKMGR